MHCVLTGPEADPDDAAGATDCWVQLQLQHVPDPAIVCDPDEPDVCDW